MKWLTIRLSASHECQCATEVGALCAGLTTYFAVTFLLRFFETNRLTPFGIYCLCAGGLLTLAFAVGV